MSTLERRFGTALRAVATRTDFSSAPDSPGNIVGYAATYRTLSSDLGGFRERINPGAFDKSLRNGDDVRCLIGHDPNLIVGRTKNGTLRLASDATGLRMACALPNTSYARDLMTSVGRGDLSECSFGFSVDDDDWTDEDDPDDRGARIKVRTLRSVRVLDVSVVAYPAYPGTSVSAEPKAMAAAVGRSRSFEQLFPQGVPVEVRSRVPDVRERLERGSDRRRRLTNQVLSI
jgi:Escherichia/Staphylococcus phage prohead protease